MPEDPGCVTCMLHASVMSVGSEAEEDSVFDMSMSDILSESHTHATSVYYTSRLEEWNQPSVSIVDPFLLYSVSKTRSLAIAGRPCDAKACQG